MTLAYAYDPLGRPTGVYEGSTSGTQRAGWTYDTLAKGQLTSTTRYVGTQAYASQVVGYNNAYQPTGTTTTIPSGEGLLAGSFTFTNTYNVDGSLATTRLPLSGGLGSETLTYDYDATTGLPSKLRTNFGGTDTTYVSDVQYTRFGEPSVLTMANSGSRLTQQAFYYDEATRRLTESLAAKETAPSMAVDAHYEYTDAGQITKISDTPAGSTADTQCFSHDYLGRTTEAWTPQSGDCAGAPGSATLGGAAPYWQSWTFDSTGNRSTQVNHNTAAGDVKTTYAYQGVGATHAHALATATTTDAAGASVTGAYTYDPAGNTLTRPGDTGPQTLTWDAEGQLGTVSETEGTSSYVYDTAGNRMIAHDPDGASLYLGPIELRLTRTTSKVTATRYYEFAGQTIGCRTAAGVTWLAEDQHGTQSVAIDAVTQQVTKRYQSPFGVPRGTNPTWVNSRGFVGGTLDATGLTHLGAREYDTTTGRFLSVDPLSANLI